MGPLDAAISVVSDIWAAFRLARGSIRLTGTEDKIWQCWP